MNILTAQVNQPVTQHPVMATSIVPRLFQTASDIYRFSGVETHSMALNSGL
ncbi:MAG: hypothetical protein QGG39_10000 [Candidatus Poribacteria bacterium]|nr:hypothetical protein [Candidatus Poribacteria bacterium]